MRLLQQALTFDDILLVPAHSNVLPREVSLKTQLTRNIQLNIPLLSAAMDTVTEATLAIALAQEGGLGFIHKNMTAIKQAAHVARVKRFESGIVNDPITIQSHLAVRDVLALTLSLIHICSVSINKNTTARVALFVWWSWGESNPRPQIRYRQFYILSLVV